VLKGPVRGLSYIECYSVAFMILFNIFRTIIFRTVFRIDIFNAGLYAGLIPFTVAFFYVCNII